ncbi:MAG TPA: porin family protein [Bacteroidia bacterium]|jgi:hypothetical protein|nr:porin family protein [Bacteroidia bacterium]
MKKIILMLVLIALYGHTSNAQEEQKLRMDYRERFMVGVKVGANFSNVYDKNGQPFHTESKLGLATGLMLAIPIGKYIGLQPEVLFSQKGFKATSTVTDNAYVLTRTSNFIDVPFMLAAKLAPFLTLLAGPQYAYLISQKNTFENASTSISKEQDFENENTRKNMFCFTAGFDITLKHVVIAARAGWDLQNNSSAGAISTSHYKNNWIQATLGYRFYKP